MKKLSDESLANWSHANRTMLIDQSGNKHTYSDIKRATKELSARLKQNSLVMICAFNDAGAIIFYLACLENKNAILILDRNITDSFFINYIKNYQPAYIIINKERSFSVENYSFEFEAQGYKIYRIEGKQPSKLHSQLRILMTTSGSTGDPKLVRLSLRNIISNADSIISYLKITEADVAITTLPIQYSYGLSVINSHIRAGGTIVLSDRSVMEPEFWNVVKKYKVTNISGVPFTYDLILKLDFTKYMPNSIRMLTQAGGGVSKSKVLALHEKCKELNIKFYTMYGQTEASPRMSYLDPEYLPTKAGSIGKPIPGGSMWLESETGEKINNSNVIGELIYKGPNVGLGYAYAKEDLLKDEEWLGVLKTGDLALRDSDGFYYIQGRKKRFIKISGIRTSLDQIEKHINDFGVISAAIGSDDFLVIFIEGEFDQKILAEVKSTLKSYRIMKDKYIVKFKLILPRNQAGKLNYTLLEV